MHLRRGRSFVNRLTANFKGPRDIHLFLRITVLYLFLRFALLFVPPTKLVGWLDRGKFDMRPIDLPAAAKFTNFVVGATRGKEYGCCLSRSLILFRLLRRAGFPVALNLGLDKLVSPAARLNGHAWVSIGGAAVMEREDPSRRYELMYCYQAQSHYHDPSNDPGGDASDGHGPNVRLPITTSRGTQWTPSK